MTLIDLFLENPPDTQKINKAALELYELAVKNAQDKNPGKPLDVEAIGENIEALLIKDLPTKNLLNDDIYNKIFQSGFNWSTEASDPNSARYAQVQHILLNTLPALRNAEEQKHYARKEPETTIKNVIEALISDGEKSLASDVNGSNKQDLILIQAELNMREKKGQLLNNILAQGLLKNVNLYLIHPALYQSKLALVRADNILMTEKRERYLDEVGQYNFKQKLIESKRELKELATQLEDQLGDRKSPTRQTISQNLMEIHNKIAELTEKLDQPMQRKEQKNADTLKQKKGVKINQLKGTITTFFKEKKEQVQNKIKNMVAQKDKDDGPKGEDGPKQKL